MWSESGIDLGDTDFLWDAGDLDLSSSKEPLRDINRKVDELISKNNRLVILGGDHAVTYPIITAFHHKYPKLNILHLDAHPDLYDTLNGDRFSHACSFARIMEEGLAARLVQVGIRTMNGHQRDQADRLGVEVHEMKTWQDDPPLSFEDPLYISFDMDVLDPAFAPGVSHFEPGGLTTRQAIRIIQQVQAPEIVGADIVEYNPKRDHNGVTAMTAAKIFKEIADRILR